MNAATTTTSRIVDSGAGTAAAGAVTSGLGRCLAALACYAGDDATGAAHTAVQALRVYVGQVSRLTKDIQNQNQNFHQHQHQHGMLHKDDAGSRYADDADDADDAEDAAGGQGSKEERKDQARNNTNHTIADLCAVCCVLVVPLMMMIETGACPLFSIIIHVPGW